MVLRRKSDKVIIGKEEKEHYEKKKIEGVEESVA